MANSYESYLAAQRARIEALLRKLQKRQQQPSEVEVDWLDTKEFEAALRLLTDTVLPCLEVEDPTAMQVIGLLFFYAPTQHSGEANKETRTTFMELGARKAGDYGDWLTKLKTAADNLVRRAGECEPIVAELVARLHPVSCAKLASVAET